MNHDQEQRGDPSGTIDVASIHLDREDVVLLVLKANEELFQRESFNGITRLEKILFLIEKETDFEGIADFFVFKAHNFGPFSKEVYEAVDFLASCDLITIREKSYVSYYAGMGEASLREEIDASSDDGGSDNVIEATEKVFSLTPQGRKVADIMHAAVRRRRPKDIAELERILVRFVNLPLNQLIRYVYTRYPAMTVKSIHPEAKRIRKHSN